MNRLPSADATFLYLLLNYFWTQRLSVMTPLNTKEDNAHWNALITTITATTTAVAVVATEAAAVTAITATTKATNKCWAGSIDPRNTTTHSKNDAKGYMVGRGGIEKETYGRVLLRFVWCRCHRYQLVENDGKPFAVRRCPLFVELCNLIAMTIVLSVFRNIPVFLYVLLCIFMVVIH